MRFSENIWYLAWLSYTQYSFFSFSVLLEASEHNSIAISGRCIALGLGTSTSYTSLLHCLLSAFL
jgi:hypothetical protein